MLISRKTDYALILIGALKPTFRSGDFVPLKLIARQYRLPYAYAEKLASTLKRAGFRLARDPKKITLQSIVNIFQVKPIVRCMISLGLQKSCALSATCPTRASWN